MIPGLVSSARCELIGLGTGVGTSVTPGNAVKGSYATIGTTNFRYDELVVHYGGGTRRQRLDIAINTGGADTIVAADLPLTDAMVNGSNIRNCMNIELPIAIPSGASIKARGLGSAASGTCDVFVSGFMFGPGGYPGRAQVISCTDWSTADPPGVALAGTSFTAWTTLCASTSRRICRLWVFPSANADATRTVGTQVFEIAVGAAASEQIIGAGYFSQSSTLVMGTQSTFKCDIPAGSRLSFRAQSSGASADTLGVAAIGLAV